MKLTIYRQVTKPRRTSRPRAVARPGAAGFTGLLSKLSGASDRLSSARKRVRGA